MLLNNFYFIRSCENTGSDPEKYTLQIELNEKHPIFDGHFPGMPVTPGVCLVQMVKESAGVILKKKLMMSHADNIKFMAIVNPMQNKQLMIDISLKPDGPGQWLCEGVTY